MNLKRIALACLFLLPTATFANKTNFINRLIKMKTRIERIITRAKKLKAEAEKIPFPQIREFIVTDLQEMAIEPLTKSLEQQNLIISSTQKAHDDSLFKIMEIRLSNVLEKQEDDLANMENALNNAESSFNEILKALPKDTGLSPNFV